MRSFRFEDEDEEKTVIIKEILDPSYGCYLWPSSSVLAEYIWRKKDLFRDKTILELGAGTSLPGFLCALLSPNNHVILTDRSDVPQILENIKQAAELNGIEAAYENNNDNLEKRVWIRGLKWGEFDERGLFCLLDDLEKLGRHVDWILGSDTFYDPKDFEDLISTVAYILTFHAPPHAKFLTSYQERSSKRSIQFLADKWKLSLSLVPLDQKTYQEISNYQGAAVYLICISRKL